MFDSKEQDDDTSTDVTVQVHSHLRRMILFHRLPPGSRLNIRWIANKMNVSATPVRESLIRLAEEGLIGLTPGRAYYTKPLLANEITEEYETALLILKYSVERNITKFSGSILRKPIRFGENIRSDEIAPNLTRSYSIFLESLYEQIVNLSANAKMLQIIRHFNNRTTHIREIDIERPDRLAEITANTTELIDLLEAQNTEGAIQNLQNQYRTKVIQIEHLVMVANSRALANENPFDK